MSQNPYLSGNFAPVEDELSAVDLPVTGELPPGLCGRLLRIGPNPVSPDPKSHHWFLGTGMVHGLRLRDGRAEWYRSRYVRDDRVVAARGWPPVPGPRGKLQMGEGVVNTNVISHAGKILALVEAGNLPVELDAGGVRMLLAHGDGLGRGDIGYRLIRPLLRSRTGAALFRTIHPTPGTFLARKFSDTSKRILRRHMDRIPPGLERWAGERLEDGYDIVMTGHTHLDTVRKLEKGIYVSLGDWLTRFTYCRLEDGSAEPELLSYLTEASKGGNDERNS